MNSYSLNFGPVTDGHRQSDAYEPNTGVLNKGGS